MKNKIKSFIYKYRYDLALAGIFLVMFILVLLFKDDVDIFNSRESFENFIDGFGFWAPLVVIGSIILEVVVAPVPGFIIAAASGFLFGPIEGSIYVYVGNVLGSLLVFFVARKLGKKVVQRIFKKHHLEKYEKAISKHENYLLFFYFLPILPIDVITAAFGLSGIRTKKFVTVLLFGYILYSVVITNFGDYLAKVWF